MSSASGRTGPSNFRCSAFRAHSCQTSISPLNAPTFPSFLQAFRHCFRCIFRTSELPSTFLSEPSRPGHSRVYPGPSELGAVRGVGAESGCSVTQPGNVAAAPIQANNSATRNQEPTTRVTNTKPACQLKNDRRSPKLTSGRPAVSMTRNPAGIDRDGSRVFATRLSPDTTAAHCANPRCRERHGQQVQEGGQAVQRASHAAFPAFMTERT
jgi:hypothetical protein